MENTHAGERNANIELLRMLAMVMVIILHNLAGSGALYEQSGLLYHFYWWMEALAVCAVDVFVLISGYFLCCSKFRIQNVFRILAVVWVYSFPLSLLSALLSGNAVLTVSSLKMFFPVLTKKYWFVNAYLALYLFSPFLNKLIRSLRKNQFAILLWMVIGLMILRPTLLPKAWAQDMTAGLSVFFFIALYFIAAWVRLYGKERKVSFLICLPAYLLLSLFLAGVKAGLMHLGISEDTASRYYSYDSAFVVLEALALFMAFLKARQPAEKKAHLINSAARYSFAAYIIHYALNAVLWRNILHVDRFVGLFPAGPLMILLSSIAVFLACTGLEYLRSLLAKRLVHSPYIQRFRTWETQWAEKWNRRINSINLPS